MDSPKLGPRQILYRDDYKHIYSVTADFGNFTKEYFVTDSGERAGIIALRGQTVLLVKQYRLLINGLSWEIPGGRVDDGETPEAAAVRECLEETGVRCLNPRPLISYHPGLDTTHNPTHMYYCTEVAESSTLRCVHAQEISGVEWVPLTRCIEMILEGQIVDSFSIIGLLAYQAQRGYS